MKALKVIKATGFEDIRDKEVTTFLFSKEEAMEFMRAEIERIFREMETIDPHFWSYLEIQTITDDDDDN